MDGVSTKRPIAQALLERLLNARNPEELRLLEICFQNWGTPEGNRIRPHFTLLYNYRAERAAAEKEVGGMQVPDSLRNITFTRLGIVEIDFWGNPVPGGLLA